MAVGSELARLDGYPFEVRYSDGALVRATAAADVAADAYVYFSRLFSAVEPDIAIITLVAPAHLEELGGLEGVAREKAVLPAATALPGSQSFRANARRSRPFTSWMCARWSWSRPR